MYSSKDDIELLIEELKNIRASLYRYNFSKAKDSIDYLNRAIAILEAYKTEVNQRQFQPEPLPQGDNLLKKKLQKKFTL
ncbi:hypothetical protein B4U84_20375 [Westiellopsis prolifica IICB1]|nr:hypothetical protein B4U84_20375 [Westiellopsis prolifica IICB1]